MCQVLIWTFVMWRFAVILWQLSPLPDCCDCCDPGLNLQISSSDTNLIGLFCLEFYGSARVSLSPRLLLVTVWCFYHKCVDFPFFPPGSTQVFDINLLHDLASVSDRHSLDLSLTPSVVLVVFDYYGLPGAILLRSCTWKITFFSFVLETLF